ncbi:MAG: efflux RND transporter periplasmic adaptor subunit [Thermoanaerobaculia bacterium]
MRLRPTSIALLVPLLAACGGAARKPAAEPAPVRVAEAVRKPVPVEVVAIGHVEALSTVAVRPQAGGAVTQVSFREGDEVAAGQLLFTIDPRPYEAALAQAKANLARDRARLAEAGKTLERYRELVAKEYVTREQFDQAQANSEALVATIEGDEAAVEQAKLNLAYCRVTAPIAGRTGSLLVHAGNLVRAGDDKALVTINRLEPIRVTFALPERELLAVQERAHKARLAVSATPPGGGPREGELAFVDNAVDATTGTIDLKADFPNKDRALWPGQFVNVALTLETETGALVVPAPAIQNGQSGAFVWVVGGDGKAEARPVTVKRTWQALAILADGVKPGEKVVVDGQLRLAPGAAVSILGEGGAKGAEPPRPGKGS